MFGRFGSEQCPETEVFGQMVPFRIGCCNGLVLGGEVRPERCRAGQEGVRGAVCERSFIGYIISERQSVVI